MKLWMGKKYNNYLKRESKNLRNLIMRLGRSKKMMRHLKMMETTSGSKNKKILEISRIECLLMEF